MSQPSGLSPKIPGPQVPPRTDLGQDRLLSVSGKKKCSHCKEELGRLFFKNSIKIFIF